MLGKAALRVRRGNELEEGRKYAAVPNGLVARKALGDRDAGWKFPILVVTDDDSPMPIPEFLGVLSWALRSGNGGIGVPARELAALRAAGVLRPCISAKLAAVSKD